MRTIGRFWTRGLFRWPLAWIWRIGLDAVAATFQEELAQAIEVIMAVERDRVPKEHHRVSFMTEDGD